MSTILNERGQSLQKGEKLKCWNQHYEKVLKVQNEVGANVLGGILFLLLLEEHSETDTPLLTREEIELAVKKLQDGKAAGEDKIVADEKNLGEMMID